MESHDISPNSIITTTIPYIHPKLKLEDLQANGKLFSDAQINAIKNSDMLKSREGRITKRVLNSIFEIEIENGLFDEFKFSLQKSDESLQAIYKG